MHLSLCRGPRTARETGTQRLGAVHPPRAAGVDGPFIEFAPHFPIAENRPSSPGPLEERCFLQKKGLDAVRRCRSSNTPPGFLFQDTLQFLSLLLPGDKHAFLRQFSGDPCPVQRCVLLLQKTLPESPGLPVSRAPPHGAMIPGSPEAPPEWTQLGALGNRPDTPTWMKQKNERSRH